MLLSWSWLGGAMILNLSVAAVIRRQTAYLLGLIIWLQAVGLVGGGTASAGTIQAGLTAYPLVFVVGSQLQSFYNAVLQ